MACSLLVTRFDSEERLALYKAKAGHTLRWMCSDRFVENNQTNFIFKHHLQILLEVLPGC